MTPEENGSRRLLGRRPDSVDDDTVEAAGSVSEALEWAERARGHLYSFHQLMDHADRLASEMLGRNVIAVRWTFQVVEDFDDNYRSVLRGYARDVRGARQVFEAEMEGDRRSAGRPRHEAGPVGDGREKAEGHT